MNDVIEALIPLLNESVIAVHSIGEPNHKDPLWAVVITKRGFFDARDLAELLGRIAALGEHKGVRHGASTN